MVECPVKLSDGASRLAALLAASARGDQMAFKGLYDATSAKLFGVALVVLRRRNLAEEVLQEAYIRIWRNAERYDATRSSPVSWMATIVRNLAIDIKRSRREEAHDGEEELLALPDNGIDAFEHVQWSDDVRQLHKALRCLDPVKRQLVTAAYLEGASREQLSQRFGVPVATVKSWLRRALTQLRSAFDEADSPRRKIAA